MQCNEMKIFDNFMINLLPEDCNIFPFISKINYLIFFRESERVRGEGGGEREREREEARRWEFEPIAFI